LLSSCCVAETSLVRPRALPAPDRWRRKLIEDPSCPSSSENSTLVPTSITKR
jgi:hypothetical protein